MSILSRNPDSIDTIEVKKIAVQKEIIRKSQQLLDLIVIQHNSLMRDFWENDDGLTPQEVSDALGTDATSLFQLGGSLIQTVTAVAPDAELTPVPADKVITHNPDGSVTITDA